MKPPDKIYWCERINNPKKLLIPEIALKPCVMGDSICYVRQGRELAKLEKWIKLNCPECGWGANISGDRILNQIQEMKGVK